MIIRTFDIVDIDGHKSISRDFVSRLNERDKELLCRIIAEHYNTNLSWFVSHNVREICFGLLSVKMKDVHRMKYIKK